MTSHSESVRIQSERMLVQSLVNESVPAFLGNAYRLHLEIAVGRSVADIVAVSAGRTSAMLRPLTITQSVALSHLRQRFSTRVDVLEKLCGEERYSFRLGALDPLYEMGLIRRGKGGSVSIASKSAASQMVVAFEAKMHRWTTALQQAASYTKFADLVYVVLPSEAAQIAIRHADKFFAHRVGLLVENRGVLHEAVGPSRIRQHSWQRDFVLSRLLSASAAPK